MRVTVITTPFGRVSDDAKAAQEAFKAYKAKLAREETARDQEAAAILASTVGTPKAGTGPKIADPSAL